MGLITGLLGLPFLPVWGTVAIAEQVMQAAEEQYYDPVRIRAELDEVDRMRRDGELTDEEAIAYEEALVERLLEGQARQRRED